MLISPAMNTNNELIFRYLVSVLAIFFFQKDFTFFVACLSSSESILLSSSVQVFLLSITSPLHSTLSPDILSRSQIRFSYLLSELHSVENVAPILRTESLQKVIRSIQQGNQLSSIALQFRHSILSKQPLHPLRQQYNLSKSRHTR